MEPKITKLNYTYKKPDADVWVLNLDDIPVDKSQIKDQQLVHLAPQSIGGNHRHARTEWFVGIGDVLFMWLDDGGQRHEELMHPEGQIVLIEVPPYLAHAVVNRSADREAVLWELSNEKKSATEMIKVA